MATDGHWGVYAILDTDHLRGRRPAAVAGALLLGGAGALQLRDKKLPYGALLDLIGELRPLCSGGGIPLIINDHVHAARDGGADGVHLGRTDMPVGLAREILGPGKLIGLSTHSRAQALEGERSGADYLGFGPIFATSSKARAHPALGVEEAGWAATHLRIPFVAIGGISLDRLAALKEAGVRNVAAIAALLDGDDPESDTRAFVKAMRAERRA